MEESAVIRTGNSARSFTTSSNSPSKSSRGFLGGGGKQKEQRRIDVYWLADVSCEKLL
jgi:hypothetical protein